jgi:hypothetical protein
MYNIWSELIDLTPHIVYNPLMNAANSKGENMADDANAETEEALYNDLRDQPCILCGEPYAYVLGSYIPDDIKRKITKDDKAPVLYYTLCEKCFNNGRIPSARIEAAYRAKFGKLAA